MQLVYLCYFSSFRYQIQGYLLIPDILITDTSLQRTLFSEMDEINFHNKTSMYRAFYRGHFSIADIIFRSQFTLPPGTDHSITDMPNNSPSCNQDIFKKVVAIFVFIPHVSHFSSSCPRYY